MSCDEDYDEYEPPEEDLEPCGSCDQCGQNLYIDDVWYVGNYRLCNSCAWHAMQARKK